MHCIYVVVKHSGYRKGIPSHSTPSIYSTPEPPKSKAKISTAKDKGILFFKNSGSNPLGVWGD
jgi:hypothetical protein